MTSECNLNSFGLYLPLTICSTETSDPADSVVTNDITFKINRTTGGTNDRFYYKKWAYLKFVQLWPPTACFAHKRRGNANKCTFPKDDDWTIHGIWPSNDFVSDKPDPQLCFHLTTDDIGGYDQFKEECLTGLGDQLQARWVDVQTHSDKLHFWRHEWVKHGTCAADIPSLDGVYRYFKTALEWSREYNIKSILEESNIVPGATYPFTKITTALEVGLNETIAKIYCIVDKKREKQYLNEIQLCLDKENLQPINCTEAFDARFCNPEQVIQYLTKDQVMSMYMNTFEVLRFSLLWPPSVYLGVKQDNPTRKCKLFNQWTVEGLRPATVEQRYLIDEDGKVDYSELRKPDRLKNEEPLLDKNDLLWKKMDVVWENLYHQQDPQKVWAEDWWKYRKYIRTHPDIEGYPKYLDLVDRLHRKYTLEGITPGDDVYTLKGINAALSGKLEGKIPKVSCVLNKENGKTYLHKIEICLNEDLEPIDCLSTEDEQCNPDEILYPTYENVLDLLPRLDYLEFVQQWAETPCLDSKGRGKRHKCGKWVIRGLWPFVNGMSPVYCDSESRFDETILSSMPGLMDTWTGPGEFLEEQWMKYGTCVGKIQRAYFKTALNLYREYNMPRVLKRAAIQSGKKYSLRRIERAIRTVLKKRPRISCTKSNDARVANLVQIEICLDNTFRTIDCVEEHNRICVKAQRIAIPRMHNLRQKLRNKRL